MPAFPAYGELLLDGFGEQPETSLIRTEMETGPAKQAQVRSKQIVNMTVTYTYTSAEFILWKAWRKNDIALGALYFDWRNPLTGNLVQARIPGGDYNADAFDGKDKAIEWEVSFVMEFSE